MSDKAAAAEAKNKGNKALAAKDFDEAVKYYSEAIALDPSDHVFFSNRSAAYLSKGDAPNALKDAEQCLKLAPSWGKGFSRKGAALYALNRFKEAVDVYDAGLRVDPGNDSLKTAMEEAQQAISRQQEREAGGSIPNMFGGKNPFGGDMLARLATNPRFIPHLADEKFVSALKAMQAQAGKPGANPLQGMLDGSGATDPRVLDAMLYLMGFDSEASKGGEDGMPFPTPASSAPAPASGSAPKPAASAPAPTPAPAPAPAPAPEPQDEDMSEEAVAKRAAKKRAQALKEEGNKHYTSKNYAEALRCFLEAYEIDNEDIAYLLNASQVHFQQEKYEDCIALSKQALERGAEIMAPYALKAKAWARIGNSQYKLGDLAAAVESYDNSLLESFSEEVSDRLKKTKAELRKRQETEYRDPAKGAEAKERGNEAFKKGDYPTALAEYSEAIKRDPENAVYYANRAAARTKLTDFNGALDDCEKSLKYNPTYTRAYTRRGALELLMKEYHKAQKSYARALELEPTNEEAKEGLRKVSMKIAEGMSGQDDPERAAKAMSDPEIQAILIDPMVRAALDDMGRDPASFQKVLRDPVMASKIEKLVAAGLLRMG